MSNVTLYRPFDLTASTSYPYLAAKGEGGKLYLAYAGGVTVASEVYPAYTLRTFELSQHGTQMLKIDGFSIHYTYDVGQILIAGNFSAIYQGLLASADIINGSAGGDIVDGLGGNDRIFGNGGNDKLTGGSGDDTVTGGAGNDLMIGQNGDDRLIAGIGNDTVQGGAGSDTLVIATDRGASVRLDSTATQPFAGGSVRQNGMDHLATGGGADNLTGNAGANRLDGGAGADRLSGLWGADTLVGGTGNDTLNGGGSADLLIGGAGADRFVFGLGGGADRIADFVNGTDRIEISSGAERFADLRISDAGPDVILRYGSDSITLVNVDHRLIDASDFLFT